jgi:hypothetical protein
MPRAHAVWRSRSANGSVPYLLRITEKRGAIHGPLGAPLETLDELGRVLGIDPGHRRGAPAASDEELLDKLHSFMQMHNERINLNLWHGDRGHIGIGDNRENTPALWAITTPIRGIYSEGEVNMPALENPLIGLQSSMRNLITQPSRSSHGPNPGRNLSIPVAPTSLRDRGSAGPETDFAVEGHLRL